MTPSHAEILKGGLAAFAQGDMPAVLAMFDENIIWRMPGANLVSGVYVGRQEVVGLFLKLKELSDGTVSVTPEEIFDNGSGTVVALCTIRGERAGRSAILDAAQVWRFEDARAMSCQYYYADQAEVDAFWS